jgi:hypothetical protein
MTEQTTLPVRPIVWASMLVSVFLYGVVGYLVFHERPDPGPGPAWIWLTGAALLGAAAFVVPRFLEGKSVGPAGGSTVRPPELVGWAMAESVAVLGLVWAALGGSREILIAFLVVAAVLLILQRPTD